MSANERREELAACTLRSGKRLSFEHVQHLEYEHAHVFEIWSVRPNGKRYSVRIPSHVVGLMKQALVAFEQRVFGQQET